jgi:hypothetical protein
MSKLVTSIAPPAQWEDMCARDHLIFHSNDWAGLLEASFDVRTTYVWDETDTCGAMLSSFAAGPFRLAYLGFPVGGVVGPRSLAASLLSRLQSLRDDLNDVAIRIPVSPFAGSVVLELPFEATPESAITDLASWSLDSVSGNHRRDIQKAMRSELDIVAASGDRDAEAVFAIYQDTVKRNRGAIRYNQSYFRQLIALAQNNPLARVMLAKSGDEIAGFVVALRHGDAVYYAHGGMRLDFRRLQPSALLIHEAIRWAQDCGCRCFNLMSSPPGQESLVWYKEKWGATTREHRSHTLALRPSYRVFQVAEKFYRMIR